jgi:hypothetical protein
MSNFGSLPGKAGGLPFINYEFGVPTLGLTGGVSIGISPLGNDSNLQTFMLDGEFSNFNEETWMPDSGIVSTNETLQVFDGWGGVLLNPTLPGVTTDVQFTGIDPENLKMRVSLTVPIQVGDVWFIGGCATGSATHGFLEDFLKIEVGETGSVGAANGFVDFLGTASLGIELPEGFSLEGEDAPPLSIISSPSQVPLPGAVWLLFSGIIGLSALNKRRIK